MEIRVGNNDTIFYNNVYHLVKRVKGEEGLQVAVYLARVLAGARGKDIGRYFAIKGPAVSYAIKRLQGRLDKDSQLRETIEFLKGRIVGEF